MKKILALFLSISVFATSMLCPAFAMENVPDEIDGSALLESISGNGLSDGVLVDSELDAGGIDVDVVNEGASDDLNVSALYPYSYNENEPNNTSLMAHNFYYNPDLSSFSGRYTAYSVDVKADRDPLGTYWSTVNFSMSGGASGYAGIQNTTDGRKAILSIWEYETTSSGKKVTVTPVRLFPDKNTKHFDNEGSGSQSIVDYPWEANHWYRVLLRCYEDEDYGHTVVEQWIQDRETSEWTLVSAFDTLQKNAYFTGNFSAFMENFNSYYCNKLRTIQLRNPYVQECGSSTWKKITSGKVSTDTWYGNKKGGFSFGSTSQYIWGIVCGSGEDKGDSGVATSKAVSVSNFGAVPSHAGHFYYEFVSPEIESFDIQDDYKGRPSLTFKIKDKSSLGDFSLKIDGDAHITSDNWRDYYDGSGNKIIYTPSSALTEGTHSVEVDCSDSYRNKMESTYTSSFNISIREEEPPEPPAPKLIYTKKKLYQGGDITISPRWDGDGGSMDILDFTLYKKNKKKYCDISSDDGIQAEYLEGTQEFLITADSSLIPGTYMLVVEKRLSNGAFALGKYFFTVEKDVAGVRITGSDRVISKKSGKSAKKKIKTFVYTISKEYNKKQAIYVCKKKKIKGRYIKYSIVGTDGNAPSENISNNVTIDKKGKIRVAKGFVPDEDPENNKFCVLVSVTPKDSGRETVVNSLEDSVFEIVAKRK